MHLVVLNHAAWADRSKVSFVPLHGFSPVVKSLSAYNIDFPSSPISDFILSFPLLEDLTVSDCTDVLPVNGDGSDGSSTATQPPSSPAFTGHLNLDLGKGISPLVRRLLSIPGGIHFRELILRWHNEEDLLLGTALVRKCSRTLESLNITCNHYGMSI